jgi:hypothetical protein
MLVETPEQATPDLLSAYCKAVPRSQAGLSESLEELWRGCGASSLLSQTRFQHSTRQRAFDNIYLRM